MAQLFDVNKKILDVIDFSDDTKRCPEEKENKGQPVRQKLSKENPQKKIKCRIRSLTEKIMDRMMQIKTTL